MPTTEYLSAQFDPQSIKDTATELDRQKKTKFDLIYPAKSLAVEIREGRQRLALNASDNLFRVGDAAFVDYAMAEAELDRGIESGRFNVGETQVEVSEQKDVELSRTAFTQIAGRLEPRVPVAFLDKMLAAENGDLTSAMLTGMLERDSRSFMVRFLDGRARAVLSSRYKVLDNHDVFFAAAERFGNAGADVWKCRLWDDGFEMFGVASHIKGQVRMDRTFDPGDGWMSRWAGNDGDVQNAAVRISNSETGRGGLSVYSSIVTKICANFCVWGQGISAYHSGRDQAADAKSNGVITSQETRTKESELIWSRVKDAIDTAFNPEAFQKQIDAMNAATQKEIPADRVEACVDNVVGEFVLADDKKKSILDEILRTGDRSQYGLTQAITHAAHEADKSNSAAAASELESIGAKVLAKTSPQFDKLLEIA